MQWANGRNILSLKRKQLFMKYLVHFCRFFVGVLFIFSGLIKLNDPIGFSYKLDEYFSAAVLGLEFLQPFALPLAIFLVIFEVVLGIMLLLGFQKKFTLWSLSLMIIFFTFLTFYSAYFEKVTDCGCFGDAIPLTPWESFYKDLILLVMIIVLVIYSRYIVPAFAKAYATATIFLTTIACFGIAYYVLMHLPILDFRAYKIGTDISKAMEEDPTRPDIYKYDWYYTVNGKEKIVTTDGLPPDGYGKQDKVEPRLVKKGYEPPIHDFTMERDGDNVIDEVLAMDKVAIVIMYNIDRAESDGLKSLKAFTSRAKKAGYQVIALSSSPAVQTQSIKNSYSLDMEFLTADQTALKTVVRSNPGVILVKKGVITGKSHWNDLASMGL